METINKKTTDNSKVYADTEERLGEKERIRAAEEAKARASQEKDINEDCKFGYEKEA